MTDMTNTAAGQHRPWWGRLAAVPLLVGIALSAVLIQQSTTAAFSGATSNGPNSFGAGTVALTDDDGGSVMFNATDMTPTDVEQRCIEVEYTGSSFDLTPVRFYSAVTDSGLGAHLDVVVEEGTGGDFADCTGFTASSTIFSGTLAGLSTAHPDYANGATAFTPASGSVARVYRITATLGADTPNSAQGSGAGATLTWETRSA